MFVAHLSDLHVSTFGDTFHDGLRVVRRTKKPAHWSEITHGVEWFEDDWRVILSKEDGNLSLIDPDGYQHRAPRLREASKFKTQGHADPLSRAIAKARQLKSRSAKYLAHNLPSADELDELLAETPQNSNLRFLKAAGEVLKRAPDVVAITGDLTDNGDGYELIDAIFAKYRAEGKLLAVPGNHDLYLFPVLGSVRPAPTARSKRERWEHFVRRLVGSTDHGLWFKRIDDVAFVGLNSCQRDQKTFYRHNGAIGDAQMEQLLEVANTNEWKYARQRIVMLHHHVVRLSASAHKKPMSEFGMRLDDSKDMVKVLGKIKATVVLHGHRHVSEERVPSGCNFRIFAASSATLGCRSGDAPSFWWLDLGERASGERHRVSFGAIDYNLLSSIYGELEEQ